MKSLILPKEVNGQKKLLNNWNDINWRKVEKVIRNLRRRIFRARRLEQWKQLRRLQKLLLKSYANLLKSVRQITQLNSGKTTSGIDMEVIKTPEDRVKLINSWKKIEVKPVKRVYIPKASGKKRPLGIPTIRDRVQQAIVKNSLEPEWEAIFEPNNYGFRPKRSCQDAIVQCHLSLNSKVASRWVLDVDIKQFFDNISHESIMELIGTFPSRNLILQWLKAGFIQHGRFEITKNGTPQGGVISPLIANIGLHGLEEVIKSIKLPAKARGQHRPKYGFIRYADDFIITAREKEQLNKVLPVITTWLKQRNLEINTEKTNIVHINEGFNYLGFNLRHYNGKLLIKPQKEKVLNFCKTIKEEISKNKTSKQVNLIKRLNPILRGFCHYYRSQVSKKTFSYIHSRMIMYLWKWAVRRHPHKGKKWIFNKYFKTYEGIRWTFECTDMDRRGNKKSIRLINITKDIPIIRHIKIKGNSSPDDCRLKEYFDKRDTTMGKKKWANNSKSSIIAKNQNYKCPVCNESLLNGEDLEIHHIIPVVEGGNDNTKNLMHLHKMCHKQEHNKRV